ncbi:MAG TPA: class F sortase [Amycolatopsis sp.]|nr:class F sortase [Amycolatopsis sp.]
MVQPSIGRAPHGHSPSRWVAVLLALITSAVLVGCGSSDGAGPAPAASTPAQTGLAASVPTWVELPSISAKSSLVQLGLNADKTVEVPPVTEPLQAGWYKYSPTPGQVGPAVILGHIDGNHQKGIFWRLHEVKVGDKVLVGRQDSSTVTFTVNKVDQVAKSSFPTEAVYGNTSDAEVRLITCGGAYDASTRNYLDNIIVYASLTT